MTCDRVVGSERDGNGEPCAPVLCGKPTAVAVPPRFATGGRACADCAASIIAILDDARRRAYVKAGTLGVRVAGALTAGDRERLVAEVYELRLVLGS